MMPQATKQIGLTRLGDAWQADFRAMASPCTVLCDATNPLEAEMLAETVAEIAYGVEARFSRYRSDNIVHRINHAGGTSIEVDEETSRLLDFADKLHRLSDGRFDITSGALRKVWNFDGSDRLPEPESVRLVTRSVGWDRVRWERPVLHLPQGMEIDLGGIGKEYAVDLAAERCKSLSKSSCLINFGGDIAVSRPRVGGKAWRIGIESIRKDGEAVQLVPLFRGGVATSGDSRRFILKNGKRYSHILDPTTGWPVENAPRSITVMAENATTAGMLATLASLSGADAEALLRAEGVRFWVQR